MDPSFTASLTTFLLLGSTARRYVSWSYSDELASTNLGQRRRLVLRHKKHGEKAFFLGSLGYVGPSIRHHRLLGCASLIPTIPHGSLAERVTRSVAF